jgi:hypothetical protein
VSYGWAQQVRSKQDSTALQTQRLAAANTALAALAGGAADAPAAALEALKSAGLWPAIDRALPLHERRALGPDSDSACTCAASSLQSAQPDGKPNAHVVPASSAAAAIGRRAAGLLAAACVRLAQGDGLSAKLDLQRALSLAHRDLANQQLVVQARGPPCQNPACLYPAGAPALRAPANRQLLGQVGAPAACALAAAARQRRSRRHRGACAWWFETLWRARRC